MTAFGGEGCGQMDRLTGDFKSVSMFLSSQEAKFYNRLRQYEDTGMTPDEIIGLRSENMRLSAAWTPLTPYTFPDFGYTVEVLLDDGSTCFAYCRKGDSGWFSGGVLLIRRVRYWRDLPAVVI